MPTLEPQGVDTRRFDKLQRSRNCHSNRRKGALVRYSDCESENLKLFLQTLATFFTRFAVSALVAGLLSLNSVSQDSGNARTVTLKQGQILQMKLTKRVSSGRAHVGDDVLLKLFEPVSAEGQTVLAKGTVIHGRINNLKRAGKLCQNGSLDWELQPLKMAGSQTIDLQFLDECTPGWRLLDPSSRASAQPVAPLNKSGTTHQERGSLLGGIAKSIILAPVVVIAYPMAAIAEGQPVCRRGKGMEISVRPGQPFYAQVGADVQFNLH